VTGVVLISHMTLPVTLQLDEARRVHRLAVWNVCWVAHALTQHPVDLFGANIFHPHPNSLVFAKANIVAGFLAIPTCLATENAVVGHNMKLLLALVFSFLGIYVLPPYLTGVPSPPWPSHRVYVLPVCACPSATHLAPPDRRSPPVTTPVPPTGRPTDDGPRALSLGVILAIHALETGYHGIFTGSRWGKMWCSMAPFEVFGASRGIGSRVSAPRSPPASSSFRSYCPISTFRVISGSDAPSTRHVDIRPLGEPVWYQPRGSLGGCCRFSQA